MTLLPTHDPTWRSNRWLLAIDCCLILFMQALGSASFGPLVSVLEVNLSISETGIGALTLASSLGFLGAVLVAGGLVRRIGLTKLLLLGCCSACLGLGCFSQATALDTGLIGMAVFGWSGGLLQVGINTAILMLFMENRTLFMNLLHVFYGLGAVVGPRLVPVMLARYEWRMIYLVITAGSVTTVLLTALVRVRSGSGSETIHAPRATFTRSLAFWWILLGVGLYVGTESSLSIWSALFLEREAAVSGVIAARALSNFWLGLMIGRVLCVGLAKKVTPSTILLILTCGIACTIAWFVMAPSPITSPLKLPIIGLFCSGTFATLFALAGDRFPDQVAMITSWLLVATGLGLLLTPPLIGILAATYGVGKALYVLLFSSGSLAILALLVFVSRGCLPMETQL